MNPISIPLVVIASISFYVGIYHLLLAFRRKQHREDLTFALLCLSNGFYDIFCAGLYNATSVPEGANWQRYQFITLAVFNTAFVWFVFDYTRQKPQKITYAIAAVFMISVGIQIIDHSGLTWQVSHPSIKDIALPLGLHITYYEAKLGVFSTIQGFFGLLASTYILWIGVRFFRQGFRRESTPLLIALGFMYITAINDTAVSDGLYEFIYTVEYGYIAMILMMAYSLSNTIVEATRTKESSIESEERFRTIVENSHAGILTIDNQYLFTYVNDRLCQILGFSRDELIGKDFRKFISEEGFEGGATRYKRRQRGEAVTPRYETTIIRKDGVKRVLELSAATTVLSSGEVRTIAQALDISESKHLEYETEERRNYLESIFASVPDAIVTSDIHHKIAGWNPGAERLFGYTAGEVIGRTVDELITGSDDVVKNEAADWSRSIQEGISIPPTEVIRYRKDGSPVYVIASVSPIKIGDQWMGVAAVYTNITERKRVEAERENLIKQLEARNAELERFTYIVSHDLRSPLVTIRGFLGYLEKNVALGKVDMVKEDINRIAAATNKMQRMLNELLELSRIGRLTNPYEDVKFSELVQEAVEMLRMHIDARGIQVNIAQNLPTVNGDRARLLDVMENLLDNACKFMGDQPNPIIDIGLRGFNASGEPIFFVRDNGIGIDPRFHDRIFGLFNKLDVHTNGTGVGLAMAKRIIEEHGGKIWVESLGKGTGSTFYFSIPNSPKESNVANPLG